MRWLIQAFRFVGFAYFLFLAGLILLGVLIPFYLVGR